MNLVERKRRLAQDVLSHAGHSNKYGASDVLEASQDDTDDCDSDEGDIFLRREKFEKLVKKFEKHRSENGDLKGNDSKYNIYLKKM